MKTIKFKENEICFDTTTYLNSGNLAIMAYLPDGEPWGDVTINLPGMYVEDNQAYINSWTYSSGLLEVMQEEGLIKKIYKRPVKYNYGQYYMATFDTTKLKDYQIPD